MQIRKFSSDIFENKFLLKYFSRILNFLKNIKENNSDSSLVILRQILLLISTARYQNITKNKVRIEEKIKKRKWPIHQSQKWATKHTRAFKRQPWNGSTIIIQLFRSRLTWLKWEPDKYSRTGVWVVLYSLIVLPLYKFRIVWLKLKGHTDPVTNAWNWN